MRTFSQTDQSKITPKEYAEANSFAHMFWERLVATQDIRPLLRKFAVKDFYRCLNGESFAFMRGSQIRKDRVSQIRNYYTEETNFFLLAMLWSFSTTNKDDENDDVFSMLPDDVKKILTKEFFDKIDKNDSEYDPDKPPSDKEANEYFDLVLNKLKKANPILRKQLLTSKRVDNKLLKKNMKDIEENNIYAFRPELSSKDKICGLPSKAKRSFFVDVPFFQLRLVKEKGIFRVVAFPFHID